MTIKINNFIAACENVTETFFREVRGASKVLQLGYKKLPYYITHAVIF